MNLLIVDESSTRADLVHQTLNENGLRFDGVFEAPNAHAALGVIEDQVLDLVLADVDSDDSNGVALLEELRSRGRQVPFVCLTDRITPDLHWRIFEAGANSLVRRPLEGKDVETYLKSLVD